MELTPDRLRRRRFISESWKVVVGMSVVTMIAYGDVLLMSDRYFISDAFGDTFRYFAHIRSFGFSEMLQGNVPLWNPHIFSGTPMLGSFQAALFYPLNFPYLILPISWAVNLDLCMHVFLMGLFTYAWIRNRGVLPISAFFAATLTAFGGVTALRVLAGELTLVAGLTWFPFLLLCVDRILDRRSIAWCCAGIAGTTLQILAGHPGTVLRTAFVLGVYIAVRFWRCENRGRVVLLFGAMAVLPILLSAVQFWTGIEVAQESVRSGGADYKWATSSSFPPENLLTFFSPVLFGDLITLKYWGRTFFWDASIFMGITGLSLALYGAFFGNPGVRKERVAYGLFATFLILVALGEHGPVYHALYSIVPGLNMFRAPGRFAFPAVLFLSLLAAHGVDRLFNGSTDLNLKLLSRVPWIAGGTVLSVMLVIVLASNMPDSISSRIVLDSIQSVMNPLFRLESTPSLSTGPGALVVKGLSVAGLTSVLLGCLVHLRHKHTWATYCVVLLGIAEIVIFARIYRGTFQVEELERPELKALYAENPGDYRVFDLGGSNLAGRNYAIKSGKEVLWGYDPIMLWRYAEFMRLTQHWGMDTFLMTSFAPTHYEPIFSMLRCRYMVHLEAGRIVNPTKFLQRSPKIPEDERVVEVDKNPAPRFFFVQDYELIVDAEEIVTQLMDENFDYRKTVILESEPLPPPGSEGVEARVTVVSESTDHVTIDVELSDAAIMVNTDAFSLGWKITALSSEVEQEYAIMPANLAIRAVPLAAGRHRIRLEYAPRSYTIGLWVSGVSTLAFLLFCAGLTFRAWQARRRTVRAEHLL